MIPEGYFHLVVHVWLKCPDGRYLISRRSPTKATYPLLWECVGGSVVAGEDSYTGAVREVFEEVGIDLSGRKGEVLFTKVRDVIDGVPYRDIMDVWCFELRQGERFDLERATTEEVCECHFMTKEEIFALYKGGVLVPTLLSIMLVGEQPGAAQIIGMAGAVAAILLIQMEKGQARAKSSAGLIALLLGGGMTDSMSKFYEQWGSPALKNHYLLYTFAAALVLCAVLAAARGQRLTAADVGFGLLVGVPNYFSARFLLLSLSGVPAVVAYPTYSVGTIVMVALAGAALFSERLSRRQVASMGLILVSLALLNL